MAGIALCPGLSARRFSRSGRMGPLLRRWMLRRDGAPAPGQWVPPPARWGPIKDDTVPSSETIGQVPLSGENHPLLGEKGPLLPSRRPPRGRIERSGDARCRAGDFDIRAPLLEPGPAMPDSGVGDHHGRPGGFAAGTPLLEPRPPMDAPEGGERREDVPPAAATLAAGARVLTLLDAAGGDGRSSRGISGMAVLKMAVLLAGKEMPA